MAFNGVIALLFHYPIAALPTYLLKANCRRLHQTEDEGFCFTLPNGSCIAAEVFRSFILFIGQTG
jgi:hypothetical protein